MFNLVLLPFSKYVQISQGSHEGSDYYQTPYFTSFATMLWYNSKRKQSLSSVVKENFFKLLLSKVNCESAGRGVYFRQCNPNECVHVTLKPSVRNEIQTFFYKVSAILNRQVFLQFLLLLEILQNNWWLSDWKNWHKECMWRLGRTAQCSGARQLLKGMEWKKQYWTNQILFLQIQFCLSTHVNSRSMTNT